MIRPVRLACLALLAAAASAPALTIQLDYTFDIADGGNFFGTHPAARTTLEQAAADLGAAITSSLTAVSGGTFSASNQGTIATFDWDFDFLNPVTLTPITIDAINLPANTVRIFVGMRPLGVNVLGQGGPLGMNLGLSGSNIIESRWIGAVDAAEAASNAVMPRGSGPAMFSFSDTSTVGSTTASYTVASGALAGSLVFDNDTDDSGGIDSDTTLDNYWHFELATPVAPGQFDFYSTALHEMLHAIGIGTSETWDTKRSGTTWLGSAAIALAGSGTALVTTDGHITEGVTSFRLSDGTAQEVVMDPSLFAGTRKSLTQLDLAFLRDLGYATVPEPSTAALLATALLLTSRKRNRSPAPSGGKSCRRS